MSFVRPILRSQLYGLACSRVDVTLSVIGSVGEVSRLFRFDTGCDITTVSEDVATRMGLPAGGQVIVTRGSTGTTSGRLVPVTFRFPPDMISGLPRAVVTSVWLVVADQIDLALLGFQEVDTHFYFGTDDRYMTFTIR